MSIKDLATLYLKCKPQSGVASYEGGGGGGGPWA